MVVLPVLFLSIFLYCYCLKRKAKKSLASLAEKNPDMHNDPSGGPIAPMYQTPWTTGQPPDYSSPINDSYQYNSNGQFDSSQGSFAPIYSNPSPYTTPLPANQLRSDHHEPIAIVISK
jgi:hypothetical protein